MDTPAKTPEQRGHDDGFKDSELNRYSPRCVIYELGSDDRQKWRDGYEKGWDAHNSTLKPEFAIVLLRVLRKASCPTCRQPLKHLFVKDGVELYTEKHGIRQDTIS